MSKIKYMGWAVMRPSGVISPKFYGQHKQKLICLIEETMSTNWSKYIREGYKIVKVNLVKTKEAS